MSKRRYRTSEERYNDLHPWSVNVVAGWVTVIIMGVVAVWVLTLL